MAVLTDKQQDRRQLFLSWDIETELPLEIETFHLERMDLQEERIYYAFAYKDSVTGWEVRILFDEETQDYMVKLYFRLFTITEILYLHKFNSTECNLMAIANIPK